MQVTYRLGETKLNDAEVTALISITGPVNEIEIDMAEHLDVDLIDCRKLFSLSVEKKCTTLANLAARLATQGGDISRPRQGRRRRKTTERLADIKPSRQFNGVDQIIAEIHQSGTNKGLGAAMILCVLAANGPKPLRSIALTIVNDIAYKGEVSPDSSLFRGFRQTTAGDYTTVNKTPEVDRADCYHASPMYTALREGLAYLAEYGLVKMRKTVEYGSYKEEYFTNANLLRRVVYDIELTQEGHQVATQWGDIKNFISSAWSKRVRPARLGKVGKG